MKLLSRLSIIFFWVLIIFFVLYVPGWNLLPTEEKSINIFAWGETLNPTVLAEFEKTSGIKVNLNYYSSNEELQVKMKATGGVGYDLIVPSDYTVALLVKEGLLKEIDRSKLQFYDDLNPALLNHSFDPENRYSIPFEWSVYGLGVNRNYFQSFDPSWRAIFDREVINYQIAMNNDPIEVLLMSALYLFGKTDSISQEEFQQIRELLLEQRSWVEAYTSFRPDYFLATGNCPVALATSTLIKRIRSQYADIDFVVPKEGSFLSIENICIPKESRKENYVYELLNYLYTKESAIAHYEQYLFFPATLSGIQSLELEPYEKELLHMSREDLDKFHFFKNVLPQRQVLDLWVEVKSF